jgi:hypothetical protein
MKLKLLEVTPQLEQNLLIPEVVKALLQEVILQVQVLAVAALAAAEDLAVQAVAEDVKGDFVK